MMNTILIIDDEPIIRKLLARMMELEGYEVFQAADRASGLKLLTAKTPQLVLCDVFLPDGNGVEMVKEIKELQPETEVILLTAHGNIPDGVQAIKNGAFDYITKGDDNNKIIPIISRAMEKINSRPVQPSGSTVVPVRESAFDTVLGHSRGLQQVIQLARKVAVTDVPVLLTGETGTGKEDSHRPFITEARVPSSRSWPSTVPLSAKNCWKARYSGIKPGLSPGL